MSARRMFGVETEYAVSAITRTGRPVDRESLAYRLVRRAETSLAGIPGPGNFGKFLENGSRIYIDTGHHPEVSSPECLNPWDVVRYARAGDLMLAQLASELQQQDPDLDQILVFKGNVDYSGSGTTWGSHESYLHTANADRLRQQLVPHLVSRVIYTGAGGFDSLSPGLEFMVSPRAAHLVHVVSASSTARRGIIHTRDESLSGPGYQRQHLLCGESLQSERAAWLRVGATGLIVAMIEAGLPCADEVTLRAPVQALQTVARDVHCRARVEMQHGPPLTAIEIQRRYLAQAAASLGAPFMPSWAREVCDEWEAILARLDGAPHTVERMLDWAIKLGVYEQRAKQRGVKWQSLPACTHVLKPLEQARQQTDAANPSGTSVRPAMTPYLQKHALEWEQLDAVLALRRELFEIDTRFGQVGDQSLFHVLEATGRLDHHMVGVDRIAEAMHEPPAEGRAHERGETIRRAVNERRALVGSWADVWDPQKRTHLDLSDPFVNGQEWVAYAPPDDGRDGWDLLDFLWRRRNPPARGNNPPQSRSSRHEPGGEVS